MFCAPVFPLIHWFFSLSSFVIPSKCLKNECKINKIKIYDKMKYTEYSYKNNPQKQIYQDIMKLKTNH